MRVGGFTLVEVLVALVVLAVGMLGMALLLHEGLQSSRNALEHAQAVNLAADMAERMRANRSAALAYATDDPEPRLDAGCEDAAGPCAPEAMAGNDLRRWLDNVAATLPDGQGDVVVEAIAATAHRGTITVRWARAGAATPATYKLVVGP